MKASYDKIFNDLLKVVPNGSILLNVMEVLKHNGVVEGNLTEPIEWIFNFTNGGWNTVCATTLKEAKKLVKEEYGKLDSAHMDPDYESVRPSAKADYDAHLRLFD